jgi:hypothetical protein
MTPPRMVELQCPVCEGQHWVIDSDFRGTSGQDVPREEREYVCSECAHRGTGHRVLQKSPPEFFFQPHPLYPMTQGDFDRWHELLKQHFPDHALLNNPRWHPGRS